MQRQDVGDHCFAGDNFLHVPAAVLGRFLEATAPLIFCVLPMALVLQCAIKFEAEVTDEGYHEAGFWTEYSTMAGQGFTDRSPT